MKAAQMTDFGGPEVVAIVDVPKPEPKAGEVLVEVHAAAANPWDVMVRDGTTRPDFEPPLPMTIGGDLAGVVAAVGEGVTEFQVGDAVFGGGNGSFAEFSVTKVNKLSIKPESFDFNQSAALALVGSSSIQALIDTIHLASGQKILIHGAAGGIGSTAVQIAKYLGAYVAATASGNNVELVKSLGADEVIDYKTQDFSSLITGYDAVFDTVGGETNTKSYAVLRPSGILVSMVAPVDEQLVQQYGIRAEMIFTESTTDNLQQLAKMVDGGHLKVVIDRVFPLDQASEALEYLKTGHPKGKIVVQVK